MGGVMTNAVRADLLSPIREIPGDEGRKLQDGLALCLSGGGYRAMVFHTGMLWRLNEVGLMSKIARFSSVSGGSITAAVLAANWSKLEFDPGGVASNFVDAVVAPLRAMAGTDVDMAAIISGMLLPAKSISDRVAAAYRKHLFGDTTLQDLPDQPRFVFNATNLESGVLFRFSKPYLADYRVGQVLKPRLALASAVAASSAFPRCFRRAHSTWPVKPGPRTKATISPRPATAARSSSATAGSTTTSGWKRRGSSTRRSW